MMVYIESFLFIFFAELFLTFYTIYSNKSQVHNAGIFAGFNTILYCLNIENIIVNRWCILVAAIGAYAGTYVSIKIAGYMERENIDLKDLISRGLQRCIKRN